MADDVTFQDASLATPPDGVIVATDEATGARHVQLIKIASPTGGSASMWGTEAAGLPVDIKNAAVNISGSISATSSVDAEAGSATSSGLTTATTLYTAGDTLGGLMTLSGMAATSGGHGVLGTAVLISDTPLVIGPVRAWVFDRSVTLAANNNAFEVSDADMQFFQGHIVFGTPANQVQAAAATCTGLNLDYVCNATSLFVGLETLVSTTVHFAAADDLHLKVKTVRL